jgi:hypothetical protein
VNEDINPTSVLLQATNGPSTLAESPDRDKLTENHGNRLAAATSLRKYACRIVLSITRLVGSKLL